MSGLARRRFVAAGPGSDSAALLQAFGPELDRQGVSLYAPILPAHVGSEARHSHYRDWFAYADALDAGALAAAAFVDVKQAVRAAAAASTSPNDVVHDSVTDDVDVCGGADYRVSFGAEPLAFMAIMDGTLPEQIFVTAINESRIRATRVARLADAVHEAAGSRELRFEGAVPVHRIADRLVADPLGAAYLAGAQLPTYWEARLRCAAGQVESPVCTCSEPRRVQAILRTASRHGRFAEVRPRSWVVTTDVGVRHRLAYELRCSHAARLLTTTDGWDAGECHGQWLADPLDGQLRIRCVKRFGYVASMIHGEEVGAFAACPDLLQPLCATLGYPVETEVAVCAATANVLLVSDEPIEVVAKIIDASRVWAGHVEALAENGLSPGTKVRYLSSIVVRSTESDHSLRNRLLPLGVPSH